VALCSYRICVLSHIKYTIFIKFVVYITIVTCTVLRLSGEQLGILPLSVHIMSCLMTYLFTVY
jgi:hypothetical protein